MVSKQRLPIRLALRAEGKFWNAYLASEGTMEGGNLIGSVMLRPCQDDPELAAQFKALMTAVVNHAIKEVVGQAPDDFEERPAPTSERAGNG
jgi:hypothetical protein